MVECTQAWVELVGFPELELVSVVLSELVEWAVDIQVWVDYIQELVESVDFLELVLVSVDQSESAVADFR